MCVHKCCSVLGGVRGAATSDWEDTISDNELLDGMKEFHVKSAEPTEFHILNEWHPWIYTWDGG